MSPYVAGLVDHDSKQFIVLLAMDAMRGVLGIEPKNFTLVEIIRALERAKRTPPVHSTGYGQGNGDD